MRNRCVIWTVLCCLIVPTLAAAEEAATSSRPAPEPAEAGVAWLLEPLAAGLARALGSDAFRESLFKELEASPYVEGRIALKRLLAQDEVFRSELLWHADLTARWEAMAQALPELELYFPIREHRTAWTGDTAIRVAVPAVLSGLYRFFAPDGAEGTFEGTAPPTTPTLLLAPSEIDFDDEESAIEGGKRTGSYLRRLAEELAGAGSEPQNRLSPKNEVLAKSSGVDTSRHTYVTGFVVHDDHDPYRGSMEIEIYGSIDGSYKECQRFTGIEELIFYYLPAAGATGSRKVAYAVPTGTNTFDALVYEDDDTGCVLKSADDFVSSHSRTIDIYGLVSGGLRIETLATTCGDTTCEGDESKYNCCVDCATCGDGICSSCENGSSCPTDCYTCGNGICESSKGESYWNCSADCSSCGNGFCDPGEDYFSCPTDCCEGARICPE